MYYYIINPAAGRGKINKVQGRLKSKLEDLGIAGEFVKSVGEGDVTKLARLGIERGFKTIVAVGGDRTIHEAINGIEDPNIALGIIPLGTTNELARTLGIPDWQSACQILAARKTETVDLGLVQDKFFVTNVSLGFNTFLSENVASETGSSLSRLGYGAKMMKEAIKFKTIRVKLKFDEGFSVDAECFNVSISNGKLFNIISKKSKPQDNLLDVILLGQLPFSKIVRYTAAKSGDEINDLSRISIFKTKKVEIRTPKPLPVLVDGQVVCDTPVVVEIAKRKLRVIVSKERRF